MTDVSTATCNASGAQRWVALIRAIGGSTHRKMSMAQLRESCAAEGFGEVRTLLATGNLIFTSSQPKARLQKSLNAIVSGYGLNNQVFLRTPAQLTSIFTRNPFVDAATERPSRLLVLFVDKPVTAKAFATFDEWTGPECIARGSRVLYIDYIEGAGRSKLTPTLLDRRLGQPGTARNWNTLQKLIDA